MLQSNRCRKIATLQEHDFLCYLRVMGSVEAFSILCNARFGSGKGGARGSLHAGLSLGAFETCSPATPSSGVCVCVRKGWGENRPKAKANTKPRNRATIASHALFWCIPRGVCKLSSVSSFAFPTIPIATTRPAFAVGVVSGSLRTTMNGPRERLRAGCCYCHHRHG